MKRFETNRAIKHDTEENWKKAINFIPQDGELVMYDGVLKNGEYIKQPKFKVGDGETRINDLSFINFGVEAKSYVDDGTLIL